VRDCRAKVVASKSRCIPPRSATRSSGELTRLGLRRGDQASTPTWPSNLGRVTADLPVTRFAFPGPLRDKLVAAVLDGSKTSTTGLLQDYTLDGEPLPVVGARSAVLDSAGRRVAVIELTEVRITRLADVDLSHARDEGEGHTSVAAWRAAHEEYWHGPDYRAWLANPHFVVSGDTLAVLKRFRLVERL
jgi:uncharacterized protein YhfF